LKITIICVGKIKEKYFTDAIAEYSKRLSRYIKLNIIEVADEKTPDNASEADEAIIKNKEAERILKKITDDMTIFILAIEGKQRDSVEFSDEIKNHMINSDSHLCFIIGGSLGLSDSVYAKADKMISFSKMTFPHQLMRVVLLEQIYRAFRIINNEPYHK